jgi:hypothetical protein
MRERFRKWIDPFLKTAKHVAKRRANIAYFAVTVDILRVPIS